MYNQKKHRVTVSCGTKFHSDYTSFQLQQHGLLQQVITAHPKRRYLNRVNLIKKSVTFFPPIFALSYILNRIFGSSNKLSKWLDFNLPVLFDWLAAKKLKNANVLLTWAWSGLSSIKQIKKQGGIALVEECGSCNKFQNELLEEEYKNLGLKFETPTPNFIIERQLEEAEIADYLLCPSQHVINSFVTNGIEKEKCILIPYGVNLGIFKPLWLKKEEFTLICVGTIGVRKGYLYLFRALEIISKEIPVKCIIIGRTENQFQPYFDKHKHLFTHYEHIAHHELVKYYNQASLFVFPSLDEGMALVQLEAMACGLPIICTTNSGGDSAVTDWVEGCVVPTRSAEAIAEKVILLYKNPELLKEMSINAHLKAQEFTWDRYGEKLATFIKSL